MTFVVQGGIGKISAPAGILQTVLHHGSFRIGLLDPILDIGSSQAASDDGGMGVVTTPWIWFTEIALRLCHQTGGQACDE